METAEKKTRLTDQEIADAKERDDRSTDARDIAVLKSIPIADAFDLVDEFRRNAASEDITVAELCASISVPVKAEMAPEPLEQETELDENEE